VKIIMKIYQETSFDAAHRLYGYQGNCGNLHGHRWTVEITIETPRDNNELGILVDYRDIKQFFKDNFDHKCILNSGDPLNKVLKDEGCPVLNLFGNPTAENLANWIWVTLPDAIGLESGDHLRIKIHESPENYAEVGDFV
jgi:6-pyruvoyltetrahydropterin/6-carboxytetrahydropterin synthase